MLYHYLVQQPLFVQSLTVVLTALILAIVLGKYSVAILYAFKIGQPVRYADCPMLLKLHEKKKDTPTMGGILNIILFVMIGLIFFNWEQVSSWILSLSFLLLGAIGALDDFKKLKGSSAKGITSRQKLFLQIIIGIVIAGLAFIFSPEFFQDSFTRNYLPYGLSVAFFVFIFCGSSNAVNLTDGLDGLASGCVAIVSFGLLSVLILNPSDYKDAYNILVCLSMIIGLSLGFLWYNHFPAQVFMGDTGSLSYGGLLGLVAFMMKREWLYALIGLVFVIEAMSVILQVLSFRFRNQKRIFLCSPIHHHFQYQGMHEVKIVTRFWIFTLLCTILGILIAWGLL